MSRIAPRIPATQAAVFQNERIERDRSCFASRIEFPARSVSPFGDFQGSSERRTAENENSAPGFVKRNLQANFCAAPHLGARHLSAHRFWPPHHCARDIAQEGAAAVCLGD